MGRLTSLLLRPAVKISLLNLDARLEAIPRATDAPYGTAVGPDPLHVAILGYGVGPGWGVTTHALAMPGQLARALAYRTGRGVEVEAITENTTLPWLVDLLKSLDLSQFDAVVLSPGAYEALTLMPVARWRTHLREAVDVARGPGASRPVVVLGVPPLNPASSPHSFLGRRVREHARELEAATAELVDHPLEHYVPLRTLAETSDPRDSAPDRYRVWSESVAAALASRLLARLVPATSAPQPPLTRLTALLRSAFDADAAFVASTDGRRVWSDARRSHRELEQTAPRLLLQAAGSVGAGEEAAFEVAVGDHVAVAHRLRAANGALTGVSAVVHPSPESVDRRLLRNLGVLIATELGSGGPVTV